MMTSYDGDQQASKHHQHHHHYQQQSFFDELHHDMATPLPDLCPRDLHTGSTDDYFRLREDGEVGGRVCAGCMVPIRDRHYLSAVGNNWHVSCLVCCECRQPLDRQSTCYVHDARIYCRDDYFALFVRRHCGRCRQPIVYNELVVHTNDLVYHSDCFSCVLCNHRFTPGQQFAVAEDGNVYCPSDFQLRQLTPARDAVSTGEPPVTAAGGRDNTTTASHIPLCRSPPPNGADTVGSIWSDVPWQQLETSIRSSTYTFTPVTERTNSSVPGARMASPRSTVDTDVRRGDVSRGGRPTSRRRAPGPGRSDSAAVTSAATVVSGSAATRPPRPKRIRTTFKYHELQLMKTYFELNHNPDNNDLKQLSVKTGLSKRVLQVWFQNARAKHRRAMLKHGLSEQQQEPRQPQSHQFYQHPQPQPPQPSTLAATGGTLLQPTNATIAHQLNANPIDDCISEFSLYENTLCDYSCVTK